MHCCVKLLRDARGLLQQLAVSTLLQQQQQQRRQWWRKTQISQSCPQFCFTACCTVLQSRLPFKIYPTPFTARPASGGAAENSWEMTEVTHECNFLKFLLPTLWRLLRKLQLLEYTLRYYSLGVRSWTETGSYCVEALLQNLTHGYLHILHPHLQEKTTRKRYLWKKPTNASLDKIEFSQMGWIIFSVNLDHSWEY